MNASLHGVVLCILQSTHSCWRAVSIESHWTIIHGYFVCFDFVFQEKDEETKALEALLSNIAKPVVSSYSFL